MVFRLAVCCAIFAAVFGASLPSEVQRVVAGENITIEDTPWQVSLQSLGNHFCGGAIITRRHVLTAAHCVDDAVLVQLLKVRVGSSRHNSGGLLKAIRSAMLHENYNVPRPNDNDIAVLVFKYPLALSRTVQPIRLPGNETQLVNNATLVVAGWGAQTGRDDDVQFPELLQAAEVRVVDQQECVTAHGNIEEGESQGQPRVTDNMVCAIDANLRGNDVCSGDSGGPLIEVTTDGTVLQGIVSWHTGCGENTRPGVYTRVSRYIEWIRACGCSV